MILVTGASGLLGSNLFLMGCKAGIRIAGLSNRHRVHSSSSYQVDLTNAEDVSKVVREICPQAIIHCAAETNVDWCEQHPEEARRINVAASVPLAKLAAELEAAFLYISTDAVFDGTASMRRESDPVRPLNLYGLSKLEGEQACLAANPRTLIVRSNIYGWNTLPKQSLAEWMLGKFEVGQQFTGFDDVFFCPMLANDLASVLFEMVERKLTGLYHVCGSERISKYEFAVCIARMFGHDSSLVTRGSVKQSRLVAPRAPDLSLSTEQVEHVLGRKMPSVDEGLRRFAELGKNGYKTELKAMTRENE